MTLSIPNFTVAPIAKQPALLKAFLEQAIVVITPIIELAILETEEKHLSGIVLSTTVLDNGPNIYDTRIVLTIVTTDSIEKKAP